jgi:hypothetical protein
LEGLVEGPLRRLFRGRLEPVDLARRLGREMDDKRRVTWGRPLVPNHYRISLAADDFAEIKGFVESLQRELEQFAGDRAEERGYAMLAPAEVEILADQTLHAGTFVVDAALVDAAAAAGSPPLLADADISRTRAMRPIEMPAGPTGFEPVFIAGSVGGKRVSWPITGSRLTVGRGLDNDIVLDDASVSRHHAEITREGGRAQVRDLGSTNGTWVNARRVMANPIQPGDQLAFGAVQLEVARHSPE